MKGICFKEPLFHAVVNGTKTQTRRIFKHEPRGCFLEMNKENHAVFNAGFYYVPKYKAGETLYLKEPYQQGTGVIIIYKYGFTGINNTWKNKLLMPEKYARNFIEIKNVRCERLQDISDEDCFKEGIIHNVGGVPPYESSFHIPKHPDQYYTPKQAYERLINDINGKGTWESNPYVWVYDFKLLKIK